MGIVSLGKKDSDHSRSGNTSDSTDRVMLPFIVGCTVVVIAVVVGVIFYQNLMFGGILAEPQSPTVAPGQALIVQGHFLPGSQLFLGTQGEYVPVGYIRNPSRVDQMTITAVPPELAGKTVHVKAQRSVPGLPFLTPLLPSVVSKSTVKIDAVR